MPIRNSVLLTVTENLRVKATQSPPAVPDTGTPDPDQPLFGWWRPSARSDPLAGPDPRAAPDPVSAVFVHTPEHPGQLSFMSPPAAAELARDLAAAGRLLPGVHAGQQAADAFVRDVGDPPGQDHGAAVDERLGYGGLTVWEAGGARVSMAGVTRSVVGMVRVGSVYTPRALRGRGYAGAVTVAVSQVARDAGVREVVLFTDLANPTSNVLYQRLGYRPVEDRVTLSFDPARHALGFTGERTRGLRPAGRR